MLASMRARFPALTDQVLGAGEELVAFDAGFASFPRDGREPIRLRGFGGVDVRVRAIGMFGRGQIEQRAVVYERHDGASLWLAGASSAEEWLYFEPGQAREVLATWEVLDGVVRQRGAGVEIVDGAGVVRMSVTSPRGYAASGREVDVALTGSGHRLELRVTPTAEALLIDPLWLPTGMMHDRRDYFTTTPLEDGKVLVAGGSWSIRLNSQGLTDSGVPTTAEVYDLETNAWSLTSPMVQPRSYHTATRLTDGRVLIAGGMSGDWSPSNVAFRDVEIYDPSTNAFTRVADMNAERRYHSATLLADGRVLVVGGTSDNNELSSAEIYDPESNAWAHAAPMPYVSLRHTASLLRNGTVLVAGGGSFEMFIRGAQLYDPTSNSWSDGGDYPHIRSSAKAVVLGDGKVLLTGGFNGYVVMEGNLASAVSYDPLSNTWFETALVEGRYEHTATLLQTGRVLVTGGYDYNGGGHHQASAELYDPATSTWSATVSMAQPRGQHGAALLPNGEVLIAGGFDGSSSLASAERYSQMSLERGAPCTQDGNCSSGFCADRVCCDAACNAGDCDACSVAAGADADGTCSLLSNTLCETGRICWEPGTCESGICTGAQAVPDGTPCGSGACDDGACGPAVTENDAGNGYPDAAQPADDADGSMASTDGDAGDSGAANNGDAIDAGDSGDASSDTSDGGPRMDDGGDRPSSADAPPVDRDRSEPRPLTSGAGPGRGCACEAFGTHRSAARPHLAQALGLAVLLVLRRRGRKSR